jgi:Virulence activator alpha C-term
VIIEELEHHRLLHQETLNTYRQIESQFFESPDECDKFAKLRYLTLLNGIQLENGWLAWYEEAITVLKNNK